MNGLAKVRHTKWSLNGSMCSQDLNLVRSTLDLYRALLAPLMRTATAASGAGKGQPKAGKGAGPVTATTAPEVADPQVQSERAAWDGCICRC
jgi:hypothetical protein